MAQKAAHIVAQVTNNGNCMKFSQYWRRAYLKRSDSEWEWGFWKYWHKVVQMAHKVAHMTKNWNCVELSQNFENIVTKVVQIANELAHKMEQKET